MGGKASAGICPRDEKKWVKYGVYMPQDALCQNGRYCFMETFARYWAYHIKGRDAGCNGKTQAQCPSTGCIWNSDENVCYSSANEDEYSGLAAQDFLDHMG